MQISLLWVTNFPLWLRREICCKPTSLKPPKSWRTFRVCPNRVSPCICCWDLLILFLCVFVEKFSDKFTVWWWYNDVASQIQCYTKLLWLFFPSTCLYKTAIVGYIVCTGLKTTMVLKAWYIVVKFQDDPLKIVGKMKVKWSFYGF